MINTAKTIQNNALIYHDIQSKYTECFFNSFLTFKKSNNTTQIMR